MKNMFMRKVYISIVVICIFVMIGVGIWYSNPQRRIMRYVIANQKELEQHMSAYFEEGQNLSYNNDVKTVNAWEGKHPMVEYLMPVARAGYYGFYYSPDDVPLAFQNAEYTCEETEDGWT